MTGKRLNAILKSKEISEIYYDERPVWVQEVNGNIATVGFINSDKPQDLYVEELNEKNLYN